MDSQVRVASLDRFQDFRAAYAKFGDAAQQSLLTVDLEIRRMLDWLEKDQVAYWKAEIRRREEKLNEAKAALHRKRITATFGNVAQDTDEIVAVRKAQARLEAAQAKLKTVKQWYQIVEQEVSEYRGPAQQLANLLDADVPRALSSLDRMMDSLEGYLNVTTPGTAAALTTALAGDADVPTAPTAAETAAAAAAKDEGTTVAPNETAAETEGSA